MSLARLIRTAYLLYFSKPVGDRTLLRAARGKSIRSIVELGISLQRRTPRILEIAGWRAANLPLRYTGIDLFEARPEGQPRLPLKHAFSALRHPTVRVQLVPGDPATALRRVANSLTGTDLVVIGLDQDRDSLAAAWTWMPRMLTATSVIFLEEPATKTGETCWRALSPADVQRLASASGKPARRAA